MKYTENEIEQLEGLCRELLQANEELNARVIAMHAKLQNEEKKVTELKNRIYFLTQAFTNNTYEA